MTSQREIPGVLLQYDEPDWEPLIDVVGLELVDWFMWMHEVELTGGERVHAYKHTATRRYLHLTHDGRAFAYTERGAYLPIRLWRAIDLVFEGWQGLKPLPEDLALLEAAFERALERPG